MEQGELSMAKYYVALRKQAEKCVFPDQDDAIRTKILLTMNDKKLRREVMLKNYTLSALLKNAANKEDVERQAVNMEKVSLQTGCVNRRRLVVRSRNSVNRLQNQDRRNTRNQLVRSTNNQSVSPTTIILGKRTVVTVE